VGAGVRFALTVVAFLAMLAATPGTTGAAPLYTVFDLRPSGFENSYAQAGAKGKQVGSGQGPVTAGAPHALVWSGTAASKVDLHPAGYYQSYLYGTDGVQQVGYGIGPAPITERHAMVWNGTAASAVDLNPAGFEVSDAYGVRDGRQVGNGRPNTSDLRHALLWSGTAASVVDLNPPGGGYSFARAIGGAGGAVQAGVADGHAGIWSGTAASFVDLNPTGYGFSDIYATTGAQHAGTGNLLGDDQAHALYWPSSSRLGVIDLHPAGFTFSFAEGMNENQQVGIAVIAATDVEHAIVWSGTAASAVDLHAFLPPTLALGRSIAYGIDEKGNIFGRAEAPDGDHAVMWVALPEPSSGAGLVTVTVLAGLLRRPRVARSFGLLRI
jgi:hypothetical protein